MEKTPILRIKGLRYKAKRLKMGAYRQIIMLIEDMGTMDQEDAKEDMLEAIRLTFDLTPEQADSIDAADVMPMFKEIAKWAQGVFTSKLPNGESPEAALGD